MSDFRNVGLHNVGGASDGGKWSGDSDKGHGDQSRLPHTRNHVMMSTSTGKRQPHMGSPLQCHEVLQAILCLKIVLADTVNIVAVYTNSGGFPFI
jgi:hypothetical protein